MRSFLILFLFFYFSMAWAQDQDDRGSTGQEFEIKREYLKNRYADFYIRENEADREDRERLRGADDHRKDRNQRKEAYDQARREFVANRKQKPAVSDEEYLKELEEQKKRHQQARAEYKRRRDELRRIEKNTGVIPDWIEYELYEPYEVSETPN